MKHIWGYVIVFSVLASMIGLALVFDLRGAPLPDPPLLVAAFHDDKREVSRLLALGTPVDTRNENGETALFRALQVGDDDLMALLLSKGADIGAFDKHGESVLLRAVRTGDLRRLHWLIQRDAARPYRSVSGFRGVSPLHVAAGRGNDSMVKELLSAGVDPVIKDRDGLTALDWAIRSRRKSTIGLLEKVR